MANAKLEKMIQEARKGIPKGDLPEHELPPNFGIAQWGIRPDGVYLAQQDTRKTLPSGEYEIFYDGDGRVNLREIRPAGDKLFAFKSGIADSIFREITTFWSRKEAFENAGFLHKRGMLLYGPAGTGKTSIVSQISKHIVKNNGLVIHCGDPRALETILGQIRAIEPERPIVCIFEDIDAIIRHHGDETILQLLDGANQIDNVLNMATTNYPERLDKRIVSRPRRFDRIYKIPAPEESVKLEYLKMKLPKKENLKTWMSKTSGLSFAAISEAVISVVCLGNSLDETVKILRGLEQGSPSSEDFGTNVPFGFGSPDDKCESVSPRG